MVGCLVLGAWQSQRGATVLMSRNGLYWTGSHTSGSGYYSDLVANPNETPAQFLENEGTDDEEAADAAAARPVAVRALRQRQNLYDASRIAVGWPARYMRDLEKNKGETAEDFLEKEAAAAALPFVPASSFSTARVQGLQQMSDEDDWDGPKQMFHVPDLEQETDGLDMMQDYAPVQARVQRLSKAPPQASKSQQADESVREKETGRFDTNLWRRSHVYLPYTPHLLPWFCVKFCWPNFSPLHSHLVVEIPCMSVPVIWCPLLCFDAHCLTWTACAV